MVKITNVHIYIYIHNAKDAVCEPWWWRWLKEQQIYSTNKIRKLRRISYIKKGRRVRAVVVVRGAASQIPPAQLHAPEAVVNNDDDDDNNNNNNNMQ